MVFVISEILIILSILLVNCANVCKVMHVRKGVVAIAVAVAYAVKIVMVAFTVIKKIAFVLLTYSYQYHFK